MTFPDPRFFASKGALTPQEAAEIGGATVIRDGGKKIETVAEADIGGAAALTFAEKLRGTFAPSAILIVPEGKGAEAPAEATSVLEAKSPRLAFAKIAGALFESLTDQRADYDGEAAIAASAKIHPTAVIAPGAEIGEDVIIGPGAFIGHGVILGDGCSIGAHASITHASLGARCNISAGARIGEKGFGYTPGEGGAFPIPQLGAVRFGDEVDIGALSTVDRGGLKDTTIGAGTKIDNLCQIGHNCQVGKGVLVASQTGISGSCVIGNYVMIGGQVGMADHLSVGDGALLTARAGLMKDVAAGEKVGGYAAKPMRQWLRENSTIGKLVGTKK